MWRALHGSARASGIRDALATVSPRRRRWLRFLRDLPLDPDALPRPLEPTGPDDVILCGCPRTGTTLLCGALFQPPSVISVMEPWDGMRLPPAELFRSLRSELETTGRLSRGRLDIDALRGSGGVAWIQEGRSFDVRVGAEAVLAVKWPAFWRYLDLLPETRFVVTVRDPRETIASFKQLGGRMRQGLQYDTRFNRPLNRSLAAATDDTALRRVLLFDYIHERLLPHLDRPNVHVVRYERWFTDADAVLGGLGSFLGCPVEQPPVQIRPPRSSGALDERDLALIAEHCRTADALGYTVA